MERRDRWFRAAILTLMPVVVSLALLFAALVAVIATRRHNIDKFERANRERRPVGADGIVLGAGSVELTGSDSHAVLLVHGFGDTPQSLHPLAVALNRAGWTVSAPLLPGHGRPLRAYAASRHEDWLRTVFARYDELQSMHEVVVVGGLSMGAALSVVLAAARPNIRALALLAPYFRMPLPIRVKSAIATLLQFVFPYHPSTGGESSIHDPVARAATLGAGVVTAGLLRQLHRVAGMAERALPSVTAPTLYLQSREDNRIPETAAVAEFGKLGSVLKEQRWLTRCGHIITVDYCKDDVAMQVTGWFANALQADCSTVKADSFTAVE